MMNTKQRLMSSVAIAALVLLSACGSDADTALDVAEDTSVVEEIQEVETVEDVESVPSPEAAVADFTAAFGMADGVLAWSFLSVRCRGGISDAPDGYQEAVVGWAEAYPEATASNISFVVDDDRAALTYDVYTGAEEFAEEYIAQPWIFEDGSWHQDNC